MNDSVKKMQLQKWNRNVKKFFYDSTSQYTRRYFIVEFSMYRGWLFIRKVESTWRILSSL